MTYTRLIDVERDVVNGHVRVTVRDSQFLARLRKEHPDSLSLYVMRRPGRDVSTVVPITYR